jgi:hypothetical protein
MKGLPSSSLHPPDMLYIFPSPPCDGGTAAQPAAQEEWPHRRDRGPGIIHRSPPSTAEAWSWSASASAWQCLSRLAASASWMKQSQRLAFVWPYFRYLFSSRIHPLNRRVNGATTGSLSRHDGLLTSRPLNHAFGPLLRAYNGARANGGQHFNESPGGGRAVHDADLRLFHAVATSARQLRRQHDRCHPVLRRRDRGRAGPVRAPPRSSALPPTSPPASSPHRSIPPPRIFTQRLLWPATE